VLEHAYEVRIRMPYRTEAPAKPASAAAPAGALPRSPAGPLKAGLLHG